MAVNKINGIRAPYRSKFFQELAHYIAQTKGIVSAEGIVEQNGANVKIPPLVFLQNGLIVNDSSGATIIGPTTLTAPYYLTVNSPTDNPVNDITYQFAKTPLDISDNEVIVAAYDGIQWRMRPFISIKGVYDEINQSNIEYGLVGPYSGLKTTLNGSNYDVDAGVVIDVTGERKNLTNVRSIPMVDEDPEPTVKRVDRIVFRRPLDSKDRIGMRKLTLGGTFVDSGTAIFNTQTICAPSDLPQQGLVTLLGSANEVNLFTAAGYGSAWEIYFSQWSSDRTTETVAPISVASLSTPDFDAAIDSNGDFHLVYIKNGDVYWKKIDSTGAEIEAEKVVDGQANDCSKVKVTIDENDQKVFIIYLHLDAVSLNQLYLATLTVDGDVVTSPFRVTDQTGNVDSPDIHVSKDFWVYLAWVDTPTGQIYYKIVDDIGAQIQTKAIVSNNVTRIGVGTLSGGAKDPIIRVTDNREVFIIFRQDKGSLVYGISIWNDGVAYMQELVDASENFSSFKVEIEDSFNSLHLLLQRSASLDYIRLNGSTVAFSIQIAASSTNGSAILLDKYGSAYHAYINPLAGTYSVYESGHTVFAMGSQTFSAGGDTVILGANEMMVRQSYFTLAPKYGDQVEITAASEAGNIGVYDILSVTDLTFNGNNYYLLTIDGTFVAESFNTATSSYLKPDGNVGVGMKSTTELSSHAYIYNTVDTDILLARIVLPGPLILNYFSANEGGIGSESIMPFGISTVLDWEVSLPGCFTIGNDLKLVDLVHNIDYEVSPGSYPMEDDQAIYVVLNMVDLIVTPLVANIEEVPFSSEVRILGAVKEGFFIPNLLAMGGIGILDPNEQVVLGEDVPQELRSKIGFVSETEIEPYSFIKGIDQTQTYPDVMGQTSLMTGQNTHVKLIKGQVSWVKPNADELVFLSEAFLQIPEIAESRNRIAPQTITIDADGKAAWVRINRLAGASADLTVNVSTVESIVLDGSVNRDVFIIARRTGNDVIINCSRLLPGSSKDLDSDLTFENKTLLGPGVTEATSTPTWGARGAPQRTINDSEAILPAIVSMDVEIDKFFGQLRIVPHGTDANKAVLTGVDLTMKDGAVLSQEIADLIMAFEGAVLDFETGEVFEDDEITPLGVDFTPTVLADTEFAWYSVSLNPNIKDSTDRMTVKLSVVPGGAAASESLAVLPGYSGQKKVGHILITNDGGNITLSKIRQLGPNGEQGLSLVTNAKLVEGGNWSLSINTTPDPDELTLAWSSDFYVSMPGRTNARNTVSAGNVLLNPGQAAYVILNPLPGVTATLTPQVANIEDIDQNIPYLFIFARAFNTHAVVGQSFRLIHEESKELDAGLSIQNRTLLGPGVTEATSTPTWGARGAPQRTINDSEAILSAIVSMDVEIDKFFGQLRIIAHETDADKVRVTGVDLTMKDSAVLSQEMKSHLMAFEGAVIDFTTGEIFESDGITPLGIDFTPTTIADTEYGWYSLALVPAGEDANNAMTVQFKVLAGAAAATELAALYPEFGGKKKVGLVLITNNSGDIEVSKIRQINNASGESDASTSYNEKLVEGGNWSLSINATPDPDELTIAWSSDAYISQAGLTNARNTIQAGNVVLNPGQVAYVVLNRVAGGATNLTPVVADIDAVFQYDPDIFIFARAFSDHVVIGESFRLIHSESKELDAGLSIQNRSLLGTGVTEATENPEYSSRGAPQRTLNDSEKILDAMASMDVEIDKFFGQLRITPHNSEANKVVVTGVDLTMKDGAILSQEMADLILAFEGAVVDFETGEVFKADGVTPLGVDFIPTTLLDTEFAWYSLSLNPATLDANGRMTAKLSVVPGAAAASEGVAVIPSYSGQKKVGHVLVTNDAGSIIVSKIRQLGPNGEQGVDLLTNSKLISGGVWSLSVATAPDPDELTLTWDADAYVSIPGRTRARNTIQAGNVVLNPGQAAYVVLNPLAGGTANLTVQKAAIESIDPNTPYLFIFARAFYGHVVVGNSFRLMHAQSKELDSGLSVQNRSLLGNGVTEATSDPNYSGRGAPLRTIADSEKMLDAMASMDVEIDKFFGQLRLKAHDTDAFKAVVTGIDLTMKDGVVYSQEISNLIMAFDGAVINFSTGEVWKADGMTPLGNNFTPTVLANNEYAWYSIALISNVTDANNRMTVQFSIVPGDAASSEGAALFPGFAGQTKIGQILVAKDGDGDLSISKFKQLGSAGGGGGGGGGGASNVKLIEGGEWSFGPELVRTPTGDVTYYPSVYFNDSISRIKLIGTDLYVGGFFTSHKGNAAKRIAILDTLTDTWSYPSQGPDDWYISYFLQVGSDIYVGGAFTTIGGVTVNGIAKYTPLTDSWVALGGGVNTFVRSIHHVGDYLYIFGHFTTVDGGIPANRIAKYNLNTGVWSAVGLGTNGTVLASTMVGSDIYFVGSFNAIEGTSSKLGRLDTNTDTLHPINPSINTSASTIISRGTDLFLGGDFSLAGGISANRVAKYDTLTSTWSALGNGVSNNNVTTMLIVGEDLCVGGSFTLVDGNAALRVARYNFVTESWHTLDAQLDNQVNALEATEDKLYIGGNFYYVNGVICGRFTELALEDGVGFVRLGWSSDAYVSIPGLTNGRNTIEAGSLEIDDGQAAYVILNPLAGVDASIVPQVDNIESISPYTPNLFVFARGVSDGVVVGAASFKLISGESKELDAGLSIQNRSLLGAGVTEATENPEYSTRGAPQRTIDDSQKMLEAIASIDVEIDKFFGQLRLIPHETDADKVRITGADRILKDNALLSQEIANLIMAFEGAVIDFTTGEIFEDDGVTPLGVDFTPAVLSDTEYAWYSLAAIANTIDANNKMTAQIQVVVGDVAASEGAALLPAFAGQKKIGQVLVTQVTGDVQVSKIRQLGAGSGSGGGGVSNAKLIEGGSWSFATNTIPDPDEPTLTWSADAYISLPGLTNARNTIPAGSVVLDPGEAAYVNLNLLPGGAANLTPQVATIDAVSAYDSTIFVFARNIGGVIYVGNGGNRLTEGKTKLLDAAGTADKQDKNIKLVLGDDWSYLSGTLSWTTAAYLQVEGLVLTRNRIPAGNIALSDGEVAYVNVNREPGATPADLTVNKTAIENIPDTNLDAFIIARRVGSVVYLGSGGNKLEEGDSLRLDYPKGLGLIDFKIKSFSAPNLTLYGGFAETGDGVILATGSGTTRPTVGVNITLDLDAVFSGTPANDTTYYLYIDRDKWGAPVQLTDLGESVVQITQAQFTISDLSPKQVTPYQLIHVHTLRYGTGAWTLAYDAPRFRPDNVESLNDLSDVDTTGEEDGQVLIYSNSLSKYVPGSNGDTSFKLQSISSDGTELKIKSGSIVLSDGRILYSAADLTDDVSTKATSDGDWSAFIDLYTLPSPSIVDNRRIYTITTANFTYFNLYNDDSGIDLSRYIPCGAFDRTGGVYSGVTTQPYRQYNLPIGSDASLLDSLEFTTIGAVGDVGQLNSGHELTNSSFPSAAIGANLSYYNLPDVSDDSGNGRALTNNGGATFGTGILGGANQAVVLDGATQYLSSTDVFFNPTTQLTLGAWIKPDNYVPGAVNMIISNWNAAANRAFFLALNDNGNCQFAVSPDGTNTNTKSIICPISSLTGWHHVACSAYINGGNLVLKLYLDGVLVALETFSGWTTIYQPATPVFNIGATNNTAQFFNGSIDEVFFARYVMSDNDILKTQSAKYTHNKGLAPNAQGWEWWEKTTAGMSRPLESNPIVDMQLNELFFDLSSREPTNLIARKLFTKNQSGLAKSNKGDTLYITTDQLDALLPLPHGLGVVPELTFKVHNGTDYEGQEWGSVFVVNSAQIKIAGDSLVTLFGSGVNVILTYSAGIPVSFVPNRFWNVRQVSVTSNISTNDRVIADVTGGNITLYLPPNPSIGDECQLLHGDTPFSPTAYVSFDRNGNPIRGGTGGFDCTVPNKLYKAIYVGGTYGWDILY